MVEGYNKIFLKSLIISLGIFLLILYPLVNLKNSIEVLNTETSDEKIEIPSDEELYNEVFRDVGYECGSSNINCTEKIKSEIEKRKQEFNNRNAEGNKNFILYLLDTNYIILFIYFLLIVALNLQIATIWFIKKEKIKKLDSSFTDISDWAINTPPILGVLGTIVSFSVLVAQSGDIQESFSKSFFDAALTTIAGGFIYTINLFSKIYIFQYIRLK